MLSSPKFLLIFLCVLGQLPACTAPVESLQRTYTNAEPSLLSDGNIKEGFSCDVSFPEGVLVQVLNGYKVYYLNSLAISDGSVEDLLLVKSAEFLCPYLFKSQSNARASLRPLRSEYLHANFVEEATSPIAESLAVWWEEWMARCLATEVEGATEDITSCRQSGRKFLGSEAAILGPRFFDIDETQDQLRTVLFIENHAFVSIQKFPN